MKYFVGVVSKSHVQIGLDEGIMQLGHGKRALLARLKKDDWIIYYSPVNILGDKTPLQAFTAIGQVADNDIYEHIVSADFKPYRRKVNYLKVHDIKIKPLIERLSFIKNKSSWGYVFRFGLVEIPEQDFTLIKNSMV